MDITPVELDYFFYTYRQHDGANRDHQEHLTRLINTFIFNSNPYLKGHHRIKDSSKLYKLSSEINELEEARSETKFAKLEPDELESLKKMLVGLN